MEIIPVLDLSSGTAVHARAGHRAGYAPVQSVVAPGSVGDPFALVRGFREILGAKACYVADLDAIQGGAVQRSTLGEIAQLGGVGSAGPLLVDAGTHELSSVLEVLSCGASEVVVGLETLRAFVDLAGIVREVGASRVIFSLDLRLGRPMLHPALHDAGLAADPLDMAGRAIEAGVSTVLVLDVGRVGTGCGVDLGMVEGLRRRLPSVRLLAGGGVLRRKDLDRMRSAGCDGALVASAIHNGAITSADVAALASAPPSRQSPTSA